MKSGAIRAGADLGGTKLLLLAETEAGRVTSRVPTGTEFGPRELEAALAVFISGLAARPSSLGLSFPGLVDGEGRVVACDVLPRFLGWRPPAGLGAVVLNDGDAALVAEARHHTPSAALAVIVVGTGIGAAFQSDGRRMRGGHGWAGELGSIPIATADGVRWLDDLASGAAILRRAGCPFDDLTERIGAGDSSAAATVREAGFAFGLGLATVVHLLDPHAIAIGGGVLALPGYLDAALGSARVHTQPAMWAACTIAPLRDGAEAAALGAALAAARSTDAREE